MSWGGSDQSGSPDEARYLSLLLHAFQSLRVCSTYRRDLLTNLWYDFTFMDMLCGGRCMKWRCSTKSRYDLRWSSYGTVSVFNDSAIILKFLPALPDPIDSSLWILILIASKVWSAVHASTGLCKPSSRTSPRGLPSISLEFSLTRWYRWRLASVAVRSLDRWVLLLVIAW